MLIGFLMFDVFTCGFLGVILNDNPSDFLHVMFYLILGIIMTALFAMGAR